MPEHKSKPYTGVTGFTHHSQVENVLDLIQPAANGDQRLIMCGVVLSNARIAGEEPRLPNRYPPVSVIPNVFLGAYGLLNLIHYRPHRADADTLLKAIETGGPDCHGIQINSPAAEPWPRPAELEKLAKQTPTSRIVLQVSTAAMDEVKREDDEIVRRCQAYDGVVTDVLVDRSAGSAASANIAKSIRTAVAIDQACPRITVGFAGGLSQQNVWQHARYAAYAMGHNRFNLDAEGRLRNRNDIMQLEKAAMYLDEAARAFGAKQSLQKPRQRAQAPGATGP